MATKLKARAPKETAPSKPKILIFGKPGVGKTWTALDFPKCYYIDTEGGADLAHYQEKLAKSGGVYMGPKDGALDFTTVLDQIKALTTEKHEFKTLIIDSVSKLFNTDVANKQEELSKTHGDKSMFGAEKKPAIAWMRRMAAWVNKLDMNVIFIAHSKSEWGADSKGDRVEIGQTFDCWDKLEYELHLCMEIAKRGPLRTAKVRKTRLTGFPDADTLPWSYAEFAQRYGKDIMEAVAVPVVMATPEQVIEINRLLDIVKIDESKIEKWKNAAGAETFAEFSQEQAAGVITALNKTLQPNPTVETK